MKGKKKCQVKASKKRAKRNETQAQSVSKKGPKFDESSLNGEVRS